MSYAVKGVSTERGLDAAAFPLVAYGGAGPLHAAAIARANAIAPAGRVLVLDPLVPVYYLTMDWVRPFGLYGERARLDIAAPADAVAHLPMWGVTHVLDVRSKDDAFAVPDGTPALALVAESTDYRLYAVR